MPEADANALNPNKQPEISCSCEKPSEEKKETFRQIVFLIVGVIALVTAFVLQKTDKTYGEISWNYFADPQFYSSRGFIAFLIYTLAYLMLLFDILPEVIEGFKEGNIFNESLLMLLATGGAYGINEFPEALFVILFNIVGEMLEDYATDRSKKSIKKLVNNMPLYAHLVKEDGKSQDVDPKTVRLGSLLEVRPGEKVAIDGSIVKGRASVDFSSINGESLPQELTVGSKIYSGAIVLDSVVVIKTEKSFHDSTLSKIMDLVQNEQKNKSQSEKFITRFARVYTPIVIIVALLVFFIPFAISGFVWDGANGGRAWLFKALSVLLVSCPCALLVSIPIAFFAGMGQASKIGALIKGSLPLENLAKSDIFVFDKTGTLTKGNFVLVNHPTSENLAIAGSLEASSTHPLALAITHAYKGELLTVTNFKNLPGYGIEGTIEGKTYVIGNLALMKKANVAESKQENTPYKVLYLGEKDGKMLETFVVADEIKESAPQAMKELKEEGVSKTVMLSGDDKRIAKEVGKEIGLDQAEGELLPEEKLEKVKDFSLQKKIAYVGDGINDSPALLASSVGVAMGALGSDAAIEASDVVVMDDDLTRVAEARRISKKTMVKVRGSIILSLGLKIAVMVLIALGVFGKYTMLVASLSDTGVMALSVLYVMTLMLYKPRYAAGKKKKNA